MTVITEVVQRWPHQISGVRDTLAEFDNGAQIVVLTSPTGGGKSAMICDLISYALDWDQKSVLYTNRKMLTEQTIRVMEQHGIRHGVRAAGWEADLAADVQISSIHTEHSRVMRRKRMNLHGANLVIVDEGHLQKGASAEAIYRLHLEDGARIVLVTATPIDMGMIAGIRPKLVVAGTNSELRACGALVRADHYGPDEPDTRKIRKQPWEYTENDVRKLVMVQGIFARVLDWFMRLNPEQKPSILFAPGVPESIWFAEQFRAAGIRSAHIDGKDCWLDGEFYASNPEIRKRIMDLSESGAVKVLCNRFVLREAINAPWLCHGIFATVFGSLQSALQSGGRLLRSYPGKECAVIQDHGGNWWRHGSLNADREWNLDYTEGMIQGMREDRIREKKCQHCGKQCDRPVCECCGGRNETEPMLCPKCKKVLLSPKCPCGYIVTRRTRPVAQADGKIKMHEGDIFKPHRVLLKPDTTDLWMRCYYRAKNSKNEMTFRQARGLFFYENFYYPPADLPKMPLDPVDWYRKVSEVPDERLS